MLPLETNPEDLVRRIAAGDHVAEGELIERYGTGLRNVIRRWSRDPATADDLYQETLQLALEKIRRGEVREPGQIVAYLSSLAKNLSIQLYRRAEYRVQQSAEPERVARIPDPGRGQLDDLLHREENLRARRVLAELDTERDREILFRYYIAEQSTERICADLDLSADHLYRVLHRARLRYRRLFERSATAGEILSVSCLPSERFRSLPALPRVKPVKKATRRGRGGS